MGKAMSRIVVPRLEQMKAKHDAQLVDEALNEIKRHEADMAKRAAAGKTAGDSGPKRVATTLYTDPNARISGYTRGAQYQYLSSDDPLHAQKQQKEEEMPKDLLDFLNAAGPLERVVHAEYTKPRDDDIPDSAAEGDPRRRRRRRHDENMETASEDIKAPTQQTQKSTVSISQVTADASPTTSTEKTNEDEVLRLTDEEIVNFLNDATHSPQTKSYSEEEEIMLNHIRHNMAVPDIVAKPTTSDDDDAPFVAYSPWDTTLKPKRGKLLGEKQ